MHNYKYKFSVVLSINNYSKDVEECIDSVIKQDIGFNENIQLILVNNSDNSELIEEICLKYKNMYPNNIIYKKLENVGISQLRNETIELVDGKYTNFLVCQDKWELSSFSKVWNFFEKNQEQIDVVGCRIKYFGENTDYHEMDYKFDKDKIVDINKDYNCIQTTIESSIIKSSELKTIIFETDLNYEGDALFLGKIILKKCKYGILKSAVYYCKKIDDVILGAEKIKKEIKQFQESLKYYNLLISESINKCGEVIPYIQYQIAFDLQRKFGLDISNITVSEILNEQEINNIILGIRNVLQHIQDYIIIEQKNIFVSHKVLMLNTKYGKNILEDIRLQKSHLYYKDLHLSNLHNKSIFKIIIMEIQKKELVLEGLVHCIIPESDYKIFSQYDNGERAQIELIPFQIKDQTSVFGELTKVKRFKTIIPLEKINKIKFILQYKENDDIELNPDLGNFAKLNELEESYYSENGYIVRRKKNTLITKKSTKIFRLKCELKYLKCLFKMKEYEVIKYRIRYLLHSLNKRPIWLVSDRTHRANDNGMYLFKYIAKKEKKARVYFVIDKDSEDYQKMKKYGKVIKYNSVKYKLYFLLASKIISSQANNWVINAFEDKREYLKDLYKFKFVFLQHGITKDNISKWINKFRKNIKLFVTAATDEYKSIIENEKDYIYTEKEVKLLGFPRFDNLTNNSQKTIVFMPTWRKKITEKMKIKNNSSEREYYPRFKETDYFVFYNNLINDERIINVLKEKGYKGKFFIHPTFEHQSEDFKDNEYIKVYSKIADYSKEFAENDLLITDYSSVVFDFAYLKKPVVYTQFDVDTFYAEHLYEKGYFDYEKDGFGPVCFDYESSVNEIIKYIKNDCKIEDKYLNRIDKFYTFTDKNNCKRVYEEILKI